MTDRIPKREIIADAIFEALYDSDWPTPLTRALVGADAAIKAMNEYSKRVEKILKDRAEAEKALESQ